MLIRLHEFIAYFCQERHLVKHRGGYFSDVAPVRRRALCSRVQDRWVLAAAWKVIPRFKCTKNSPQPWDSCLPLSLMNAVDLSALLVSSRSTNDSPRRRRAATLEPLDRVKRKSTGSGLLVLIWSFASQVVQFGWV